MKNLTTVMGEEINRGITEMYTKALQETDIQKIVFEWQRLTNTTSFILDKFMNGEISTEEATCLKDKINQASYIIEKHLEFITYKC